MFRLIKKLFRELSKYRNPTNYLRKNGAVVGEDVKFTPPFYGSGKELKYLSIGDKSCFSSRVAFIFHDGSNVVPEHLGLSKSGKRKVLPISIGNNCFIGNGAMFLPGSSIGNNCIVAAGAVVTKQFPDNCVIGGVPAKTIESLGTYLEKNASYLELPSDIDLASFR